MTGEPERRPPEPGSLSVEVACMACEILERAAHLDLRQAKAIARTVVVAGRTMVEEIRLYGRVIR